MAWVESPLQLLGALEVAHRPDLIAGPLRIVPRQGPAADLADALGGLFPGDAAALLAPPATEVALPGAGGAWVVGDPFSGVTQARLARPGSPDRVILLDDGMATLHLLEVLCDPRPRPVVRDRVRATPHRHALGLATRFRLRRLAASGGLTVFTALPVPGPLAEAFAALGAHLERHRFNWLATQPSLGEVSDARVVLGTAMVADGLLREEPYLAWLREQAESGPFAYYPHRRETEGFVAQLGAVPGVTVRHSPLPVEVRLRSLGPGHTVLSLPTTALPTLRVLLADDPPRFVEQAVPQGWWTPTTPLHLRRHLSRALSEEARRPWAVAVADSDSYLKFAVATLDRLPAEWDADVMLVRSPVHPTQAQQDAALAGTRFAGRAVPTLPLSKLAQATDGADFVLVAATGPLAQPALTTLAESERRAVLVTGLPGIAIPFQAKGLRYRRLADAFVVHSRREEAEHRGAVEAIAAEAGQAAGAEQGVVLARLPFLRSTGHPTQRADPITRVVFAAQAKFPLQRDEREAVLLGLAETARRHPGLDAVVKLRAFANEPQTHHELYPYDALLSELERSGRIGPGLVRTATGAMADYLRPGSALVTVSSTAAIEAVDLGVPCRIIGDFGVNQELLNHTFVGSGLIGTLRDVEELRFDPPEPTWLDENYFHPEGPGLAAQLAPLLGERRAGRLSVDPDALADAHRQNVRWRLRTALPRWVLRLVAGQQGRIRARRAAARAS